MNGSFSETPEKGKVLLLAGPTASGKSALAVAIAQAMGGVVINADSLQLYRGLPLLTAQPGPAELALASHRLYGVLAPDADCSVAQWTDLAMAEIGAAWAARQLPIVVGGTGMYLRALLAGLADVPEIDPTLRAAVRALELPVLAAALAAEDPVMAARLRPTDRQRMARALEVIRATGRSLADWQAATPPGPLAGSPVLRWVIETPRETLYARGDARFDAMMDQGALAEVAALAHIPDSAPIWRALGARDLRDHLSGRIGLDDAIAAAKLQTRHYAKRQMTWLRTQFADWERQDLKFSESFMDDLCYKIGNFGLTKQD